MKTKLVLWGKNAEGKRVLTAIELNAATNMVGTYVFPEESATDDFANELMQKWRDGKEVAFPEGHIYSEQALSVTDKIIPEGLELERNDLLTRAQTEWHFVVLSSKLHDVYKSELEDLKDKIQKLGQYDSKLWGELKSYWDKVREQIKEQNLFREHADKLQNGTNELFSKMKELRTKMEASFQTRSTEFSTQFNSQLDEIDKRINEGSRLTAVFEDLKTMQRKFRDAKFTREDRAKVWKRIDDSFKAVKEKRFGPQANTDNSAGGRLNNRLDGLLKAMDRMDKSIRRDKDDLKFQERKIATTDGQLEAQIRQAKVKMIEERIRSKEERFEDMIKTRTQIEKQIEKQKERDARRAEQEKIELAKKDAQAKIDAQAATAAAAMKEQSEVLEKAAEAIKDTKTKAKPKAEPTAAAEPEVVSEPAAVEEESLLSAVGDVMSETMEDVSDTIKAVASVVGIKAKEKMEELRNAGKEAMADAKEKGSEMMAEMKEEMAEAKAKAVEAKDAVVESTSEMKEAAAEKMAEAKEAVAEKVTEAKEAIAEKQEDIAAEIKETKEAAAENIAEVKKEVAKKATKTKEAIADATETVVDKVTDKAEDIAEAATEEIKDKAAD